MFGKDLFEMYRFMLGVIVTVYASIITLQSLWGWIVYLRGQSRYMAILRRYILVHGLRMRFKAFWGDVIICMLLCVVFVILWHAQGVLDHIEATLPHAN